MLSYNNIFSWDMGCLDTYSWAFDKDVYTFTLKMVGVKKEDIDIELLNNTLRIKSPKNTVHLLLPQEVDVKTIEAKLDLGLLTLSVKPKKVNSTKIRVT